jgi:membrane protein implicated in regulation of membrane protease activity
VTVAAPMCAMMNNMAAPVRAVVSTMMIAAVMAAAVMTSTMMATAMVTTAVMATAVMTAAVVTATAVAAMRHRIRWERQRCRHCGDVSKIP